MKRRRTLITTLLAAGAVAVLGLTAGGVTAFASESSPSNAEPTADELRAAVEGCDTQLSDGEYAEDEGGSADIPVCESPGGAVHWKADFDVVCDGQRTDECNENTDPYYQPETAWPQSDGQPLNSAELPHIVVPLPDGPWDYSTAGIDGGTVAAVTFEDKVVYAVVGDKGPSSIIGEGSYALAEQLGIDPDPSTGGVSGKVVDFILFPGVESEPIENNDSAVDKGTEAATELVNA